MTRLGLTLTWWILVFSAPARTSVFFIAPSGVSWADGTWEDPLDLATALSSKSPAKPGDTLILRGGTYHGAFVSALSGAENKPVVVRTAPGVRATIDGSLTVRGEWVTYWGLEVTNSNRDRTKRRPAGLDIFGPHTKFINMVVHDAGVGIGFWTPAVDAEIYGCIIYDNGWQGPDPDRGHGHGIYTQNETGMKRIVDNILFNGFGLGIHAYTEGGSLKGFHIAGNVVFNSGSTTRQGGRYDNILVGGLRPAERIELIGNCTYHTPGKGGSNRLGYAAPNKDVIVKDNYFAGGTPVLRLQSWESVIMTGNTFHGPQDLLSLVWPKGVSALMHDIDRNTLVGSEASTAANAPAGVQIFVRPNRYEFGRASIVVYNWDRSETVTVDLRNVLVVGAAYEIRNVLDYYGAPVAAGIYSGAGVTLPMTGSATGPQFNAFVVDGHLGRYPQACRVH